MGSRWVGYGAGMLVVALGCGGGGLPSERSDPPVPQPTIVPPSPRVKPPSQAEKRTGLCDHDERVRMACSLKSGKLVSLCEHEGTLRYRFGTAEKIELELPKNGSPPIGVSVEPRPNDGKRYVASAWNQGHRYAVVSEHGVDHPLSVVVRKGAGEPLSTLTCVDALGEDFTDIEPFSDDPTRPESWIGEWDGGIASFRITWDGANFALEDGIATYVRGEVINTGDAAGPLTRQGDDTLRYANDGCEITLKLVKSGEIEAEDNYRCGGMNVTFGTTLYRAP